MRKRTTLVGVRAWLAATLFLAGCERADIPVAPMHVSAVAAPGSQGTIAFTSNRDGSNNIYVMNPDGSGLTQLTSNAGSNSEPAWSPDGTRIAFTSTRDGNVDIYIMNADGTGVTRLTTTTTHRGSSKSAWCGNRIAFESDRYLEYFPDVYVMNEDGSGVTRLTKTNAAFDESPAWSPSCDRIAFTTELRVYVMNADGTGLIQLTNAAGNDYSPAWSPDGTQIAFVSDRDPGRDWQLYIMNADGTGQTRLTNNAAYDGFPAWSPDGRQITFASTRDGNWEIYVMNADGTGQTRLTSDAASDLYPAWSSAAPPNQPPTASFTFGCSGLTCGFTDASTDPDGSIVRYSWTFGDGGASNVQNPSHSYGAAGSYDVTLTVTDNAGATSSPTTNTVMVTTPN